MFIYKDYLLLHSLHKNGLYGKKYIGNRITLKVNGLIQFHGFRMQFKGNNKKYLSLVNAIHVRGLRIHVKRCVGRCLEHIIVNLYH